MNIVFDNNPNQEDVKFLEQKLMQHNCAQIENYSYDNFIIKILDDSESIVAGINGQIGGGWLYIESLWVQTNARGKGYGGRLLKMAEDTALENNCVGVYLFTYSFQNPEFYKKYGYSVFGAIDNFCTKHFKYYLKKKLV